MSMRYIAAVVAAMGLMATPAVFGGVNETVAEKALNQAIPAGFNFGDIKVKKVSVNPKKKTVTVNCNDAVSYLPLTEETYGELAADVLQALGAQYKGYKISITSGNKRLSDLVLYGKRKTHGPKDELPFVTHLDGVKAPKGLDDANIAIWQSHGWYFEQKLNRWEWQRARIFETVEDLYTQSYVVPYLIPMLENAGAYVMSPRERDMSVDEWIIDNDGQMADGELVVSGSWKAAPQGGFGYSGQLLGEGENPFRQGSALVAKTDGKEKAKAVWKVNNIKGGNHAIYVSYTSETESAPDAVYTIHAADGDHRVQVNQRMGGSTWVYLGHYDIDPEKAASGLMELTAESGTAGAVVSADAVKVGGGIINVQRRTKDEDGKYMDYVSTDYPRWTGGARYQLQWAGAPDSIYTPSGNENDYNDDYRSRALWVNWLTGGSSMLPGREGLNIPIDLSFAFHSDAGTTMDDEIIGTLGIYCTVGDTLGNGDSRLSSRDFTDLVMTNIVNDVRAKYEPNWTRRGMWDKSYFEAREPAVPAMLLELLSHQNFADMKYGLDPRFRFDVSRAVYKGMLQFIAHRDGREYVVQPLAVNTFAIINEGGGTYRLSWEATADTLSAGGALPTYYIIEERLGDGSFREIGRSKTSGYTVKVSDSEIHSYRVIAGNDGGISFPSETLALRYVKGKPEVLIVNGFTRLGAPSWFDSGKIAGFYNNYDSGVADGYDISFIGEQMEFRREIPWMDDDAAGFGASRSNYETQRIAGNTFDYPYLHGKLIAAAGYGFVSTSLDAYVADYSSEAKIVDLILGKQKESAIGRGVHGTEFKTFTAELQSKISAGTAAGTSYMVSGSYVASDLWDNSHSDDATAKADQAFASKVLGYKWRSGQATLGGCAATVQNRYGVERNLTVHFNQWPGAESYAVESPDAVIAADGRGVTFMRYCENNLPAGILYDGGAYRTAVMGFPLEHLMQSNSGLNPEADDPAYKLVKQILNFLDK